MMVGGEGMILKGVVLWEEDMENFYKRKHSLRPEMTLTLATCLPNVRATRRG